MATPDSTSASPVRTKQVQGRREVHYATYDELLSDAERLATQSVRTAGNWTYGQILSHMAKSINSMIDGFDFALPAPVRMMMNLLMKRRMLSRTLPAGFKIPRSGHAVEPGDADTVQGIKMLRSAVDRAKTEHQRAAHPAFGRISREEWDAFQLRHCELHMSFVQAEPS